MARSVYQRARQRPPIHTQLPPERRHPPAIQIALPCGASPGISTRGAGMSIASGSRQNPATQPYATPVTGYPRRGIARPIGPCFGERRRFPRRVRRLRRDRCRSRCRERACILRSALALELRDLVLRHLLRRLRRRHVTDQEHDAVEIVTGAALKHLFHEHRRLCATCAAVTARRGRSRRCSGRDHGGGTTGDTTRVVRERRHLRRRSDPDLGVADEPTRRARDELDAVDRGRAVGCHELHAATTSTSAMRIHATDPERHGRS
jgi:hypothetical protein